MALALGWQGLRRSPITVMGPLLGPPDAQRRARSWHWDPNSVTTNANAIDVLVQALSGI